MTNPQFEREKNYGTAMAIARKLLSEGVISQQDYRKINTMMDKKYAPCLGSLCSIKA